MLCGIDYVIIFWCSRRGIEFPNDSHGEMSPVPRKEGIALALLGSVQFAIAAIASETVGFFHDGTAVPMSVVISVCGLFALN